MHPDRKLILKSSHNIGWRDQSLNVKSISVKDDFTSAKLQNNYETEVLKTLILKCRSTLSALLRSFSRSFTNDSCLFIIYELTLHSKFHLICTIIVIEQHPSSALLFCRKDISNLHGNLFALTISQIRSCFPVYDKSNMKSIEVHKNCY